jgi:hypothetical protein
MGRLIEVSRAQGFPAHISIKVGDMLVFKASGGRVQSGSDAIEILGPFVPGALGDDGKVLSPMGSPGTVFVLARRLGQASIDIITGDPWRSPQTTRLAICIEP